LLDAGPYKGIKEMAMTYFERGVAEGREEGFEMGQRQILRIQLDELFGPLSPAVLERLKSLPAERLPDLVRAALKAQSLQDLGLEK
jgi:hypothetical protein